MDFKILPFELKNTSDTGSQFAGWANAFFNIDAAQEIVDTGAFTDTIAQFMDDGFIGGLNHDWNCPIGKPVSAREDDKGLFVEGKISPTEHGKDCMILLKDKVVKKMSIGYRVLGDEMLEDADAVAAYWKDRGYTPNAKDIAAAQFGARLLTKLHLYEFSPVTVPANTMADITRVKRYAVEEMETVRECEDFLRDAGLSRKQSTRFISIVKGLQRDADEAKPPEPETVLETEPEPPQTETQPEAKTEEPPIEAALVVAAAVISQREVQALHADFLSFQAGRYASR